MADRILVTTDDLEHAVRSNSGLEVAGFQTTLASLDEARQAVRREPPPDCLVVTGGLHETGAAQLLTLARDRSISTLGLVEQTEPDEKGLARRAARKRAGRGRGGRLHGAGGWAAGPHRGGRRRDDLPGRGGGDGAGHPGEAAARA